DSTAAAPPSSTKPASSQPRPLMPPHPARHPRWPPAAPAAPAAPHGQPGDSRAAAAVLSGPPEATRPAPPDARQPTHYRPRPRSDQSRPALDTCPLPPELRKYPDQTPGPATPGPVDQCLVET